MFSMMVLLAAPLVAQQACVLDAAVAQVRARQGELLKVQVEDMSPDVPPAVRRQIARLKDALATAVGAGMRCVPAGSDAATIEGSLAKLLGARQASVPSTTTDSKGGPYGGDLSVSVSTPANVPGLRVVEVSFGIECGDDTLLLLYEVKPEGWRQRMRWQSGEYAEISGAFGDFFMAVVPGDVADGMRVVVAHGTDWCTSRFSGFKLDVLEPRADGGAPRVVWHTERSYSRADGVVRLRSTADGFELRLNAVALDLDEGYERGVVYRYRVAGDQITRVAPIATNGRGFVEEWLDMPWDEAKEQTAPEAIEGLKALHERLAASEKDAKAYVSYEYGPVRACSVKGRYEVEMDAKPGGKQFYAIQEGQNGYTMVNFGTTQDERCSGPDMMKKH
ncbi:hypothetical protein [Granulicella arctica]|uniref:Uncharacterized protein n=1 Tax=Granulicella arctica TaxID=940613 RepID=A0A7Y9TRS8_9BACT|nr:hypothetical protein [Granulicella arctica]NYF78493.1 hypothetical protein [Granulicella arctica]